MIMFNIFLVSMQHTSVTQYTPGTVWVCSISCGYCNSCQSFTASCYNTIIKLKIVAPSGSMNASYPFIILCGSCEDAVLTVRSFFTCHALRERGEASVTTNKRPVNQRITW